MRIAVFGASGRTGRPLCRQALERGHDVVAHVRSPENLPVADDVVVVQGDAYTGSGIPEAVADADAVVSVLGQTDDSPDDLLTVAGNHVLAAMADADVDRFVTLVGAGVRKEGESVSLGGRAIGALLRLFARSVLEDATTHVEHVKRTDFEWTIVRAPRLTEGAPAGEYRAGDIALGFEAIDRADVARFILDCLENDRYVREMPTVGPP